MVMDRIKKISKWEHDFFIQYEQYKFVNKQYRFFDYSNDVKREIEKLKSQGYSNCDISVRYFFSIKDHPSLKDKPDEGRKRRLLTVVDILDNTTIVYSQSFYYDLTYFSRPNPSLYGYHSSVYQFKNLNKLSKSEMQNENLLITKLDSHIEKLEKYYDFHKHERTIIFNKVINWVNSLLR
jgi:hypothetical protein